jgi:hypothetical protein
MAVQKTMQEVSPRHWPVFESYVLNKMDATQGARQFGTRNITARLISFRGKKSLLGCCKNLQKGLLQTWLESAASAFGGRPNRNDFQWPEKGNGQATPFPFW